MDNYEIEIYNKLTKYEPLTIEEIRYCIECLEIDEQTGDSGRWETPVETVFELGGEYWLIEWMRGNTEYQENSYLNNIATKVKKVTRTIVVEEWEVA